MSEQITWTHVDKLVRKMHDDRGMLPIGMTDAEVAHAFLKYLARHERVLELAKEQVENTLANERRMGEVLKKEILDLKSSKGRTKKRLDALEDAVAKLQKYPLAACAKDGCWEPRTSRSHYCDKCERDL